MSAGGGELDLVAYLHRLREAGVVGNLSPEDRAIADSTVPDSVMCEQLTDDDPTWKVQDGLDPWMGPNWAEFAEYDGRSRAAGSPKLAAELAASGRFAWAPGESRPDPAVVRRLKADIAYERVRRTASPMVDQLETAVRLVERCSPGWGCVQTVDTGTPMSHCYRAWTRAALRWANKDDEARYNNHPFHSGAVFIGPDGAAVRVYVWQDVDREARRFLPGPGRSPRDVRCNFCMHLFQSPWESEPTRGSCLLIGRSLRIQAFSACERCKDKLDDNATELGVELTWVDQ